jgi:hypothetical protein
MPAYPTHTFFSHLALRALIDQRHPLAGVVLRHDALFRVAGIAGCDIQCMPYQVCTHCHAAYRHNQKENRLCLVCHHQTLRDFYFKVSDGRWFARVDVERDLYANTHLVIYQKYRGYGVAPNTPPGSAAQPFPDQVIRHLANCLRDAPKIAVRNQLENYIAFTLGWFSHVVCDAIFKGVYAHAVKVNFFGDQYSMRMLPAAETLTTTDLSYDFGVHWPTWHEQLNRVEPDDGALKHLALGGRPDQYDSRHWTPEFGKPDPAIGRVIDAVQPLNRKWFRKMYIQPDYTAPSPRLDPAPFATRATWRFGEARLDLGQLRQYALPTGWYAAFLKGIAIYLRAVNEACRLAGLNQAGGERHQTEGPAGCPSRNETGVGSGVPSWSLWQQIVTDAIASGVHREDGWGSRLQIDPEAVALLRQLRGRSVRFLFGPTPTDYQQALARYLVQKFSLRRNSTTPHAIVIGPPAFNPAAREALCVEDSLRLKYDTGLAGLVRLNAGHDRLLVAGFSDFGDDRLAHWVTSMNPDRSREEGR